MAEEIENEMGEIPKVVTFVSSHLQRITERNDKASEGKLVISGFDGSRKPNISIKKYMERIYKYANCSQSCFVVAYVYLHRFVQRQPCNFLIHSFNVHRLLITSLLLSAKFLDDLYYNNAFYAKVGGISTMEMNLLEVDFLFGLGFQLNVTPNTFYIYCSYLQKQMLLAQPKLLNKIPIKLHSFTQDETSHKKQLAVIIHN